MIANARMYSLVPAAGAVWRHLFSVLSASAGSELVYLEHRPPAPVSELWQRSDLGAVFMCSLPYSRSVPRLPIVAAPVPAPAAFSGQACNWSDLVVRTDSPFRTLEDTFGHRLALTGFTQAGALWSNLLSDPITLNVQVNATIALARRGSPRTRLDLLEEMLDPDLLRAVFVIKPRNAPEQPDEALVARTVHDTLRAVVLLHKKRPQRKLDRLMPLIDNLAKSDNAAVRRDVCADLHPAGRIRSLQLGRIKGVTLRCTDKNAVRDTGIGGRRRDHRRNDRRVARILRPCGGQAEPDGGPAVLYTFRVAGRDGGKQPLHLRGESICG